MKDSFLKGLLGMTYEQQLEEAAGDLRVRWILLLTSGTLGVKADEIFAHLTFNILVTHYGASWRRYHTLFHIKRMLDELDKIYIKLKHPAHVEFAIFLHDIIYVVGARDNEVNSAAVAKAFLILMGVRVKIVRRIVRLITIGTTHPKALRAKLSNDEKYMSDLDLYGFSLSWDAVLGQSRDVRREFSTFGNDAFRKGNSAFTTSLLQGRIYLTEHFYTRYEECARENMRMILKNMDQVVGARPTDKRL